MPWPQQRPLAQHRWLNLRQAKKWHQRRRQTCLCPPAPPPATFGCAHLPTTTNTRCRTLVLHVLRPIIHAKLPHEAPWHRPDQLTNLSLVEILWHLRLRHVQQLHTVRGSQVNRAKTLLHMGQIDQIDHLDHLDPDLLL